MASVRTLALAVLIGCGIWASTSCSVKQAPENTTYFDRKIAPILTGSCATSPTGSLCHVTADDYGNALGNLDVSSYEMLVKRQDLLQNYGPYGMPALLVKAVPPQQINITHYDETTDSINTDIPHAASSVLDPSAASFQIISTWLERGAQKNNSIAPKTNIQHEPCKEFVGKDPLFDPTKDPPAADYKQFLSDVEPWLEKSCAAGNCHGTPERPFPLSCGKTDEQKRWNYFSSGDYVSWDPNLARYSDILIRPLAPGYGGAYHPGGVFITSPDEDIYKKVLAWATAHGPPTNVPTDAGFQFFAKRVQPMLVKRGCILLGCHSSPVFNDFHFRPPSGTRFGIAGTRYNYQETLKKLAVDSADPNASRILRKNLEPGPTGPGIHHRGGALMAAGGDPSQCDLQAAETGPLDQQTPYCVFVAWHAKERAARSKDFAPFSGIVYVKRPPNGNPETMQDYEVYLPGADLRWIDATMDATGNISTNGGDKSLLAGCNLTVATADVRRPMVSWDGKKIAFAARSGASDPFKVYVMNADGSSCAPEPTINAAPTNTKGEALDTKGELIHNFDPAFAPDGSIVFASTRGNILPGHLFPGPERSAADPSKLNANLYVLENGKIRQMTFLSNQELYPSFKSNGQLILTAEKRTPGFYQISARRMNLDGGDYHPLLGQRAHFGHLQVSEVSELLDQNFVAIASDRGAAHLAGALVTYNRSLGQDNVSQDPADYAVNPGAIGYASTKFFQHALTVLDPAADGHVGKTTQGAYRNPSALPNGNILVSYAANVTDLSTFSGNFDVVMVNAATGQRTSLAGLGDPNSDEIWPVAVFGRIDRGVFKTTPGEPVFHGAVYNDEEHAGRFELTIVDFPMISSILFQSTRSGRKVLTGMKSFEAWASLPPDVKSLNDPSPYITEDQYGKLWAKRIKVATVPLLEDGSVKVQAPAGYPVVLAFDQQLAGESKPTLHHHREEIQFYPGEWLTMSFRHEVFNHFCGGCHGPTTGKEFDISIKPDIISQASKCQARDSAPVDGVAAFSTKNPVMGPTFP